MGNNLSLNPGQQIANELRAFTDQHRTHEFGHGRAQCGNPKLLAKLACYLERFPQADVRRKVGLLYRMCGSTCERSDSAGVRT